MEPQRWEQIQDIFAMVADLPPDRKSQAVHQLCQGDPELVRTVLALLEEDTRQQLLLDSDGDRLVGQIAEATLSSDHLSLLIQRRIGPYRLLRVLGEGGMGVVYLGERTDIGGLVAIKLLRDAWLSPMRRERFLLEQQTLVKLNHPSIARIYDASTMEDGTPWFVMEYVEGLPLTEALRTRGGSLAEDLQVFQRVCEAVQYAHSLAVIHRDLKPSNILCTPAGEVKLLDFGIAKQIDTEAQDATRTVAGLRLLTPAYAAPEQSSGGSVGIFTDVYSLGVLLYEILTGALPPSEQERHGKPIAKPSTIARTARPAPGRAQLSKQAWADLDVLALTALQPEPERRYPSVDALIRDLNAYLEGRVLAARPNSFAYTAGKFARRNKAALLSASAAALVLVGALLLFTVRLAHARDAAIAAAARTTRVQRFTENLFDGGDANAGPAVDLRVSEILRRGREEAQSLNDPAMEADMLGTLGGVYQKLGHFQEADQLLQQCLEKRRQSVGPRDKTYAESLVAIGLLRKDQEKMDEAEKVLRQALALQQQILPSSDPDLEQTRTALGSVLSLHGNYAEAKTLLDAAVQRGSAVLPPTAQFADDLTQLAELEQYLSAYEISTDLNKRALEIRSHLFGKEHPLVADTLKNLGALAQNQGRLDAAESYFRQALAIDKAWYGLDHPAVADDLASLAHPLIVAKRYDEAQHDLEQALAIEQRAYGLNHSRVAIAYNELGILEYTRNQDDDAEKHFRAALSIWRSVYGEHHQFLGIAYANLAGVYQDRKDYAMAEQMCREALQVYSITLSENHLNTAIAHLKLGRVLIREQRYKDAEPETQKAYQYLATHVDPKDSYLAAARRDLLQIESQLHSSKEQDRSMADLIAPGPKPKNANTAR